MNNGNCNFLQTDHKGPYEFTACVDGLLYDLESGDGDGSFRVGGDHACPVCNKKN